MYLDEPQSSDWPPHSIFNRRGNAILGHFERSLIKRGGRQRAFDNFRTRRIERELGRFDGLFLTLIVSIRATVLRNVGNVLGQLIRSVPDSAMSFETRAF